MMLNFFGGIVLLEGELHAKITNFKFLSEPSIWNLSVGILNLAYFALILQLSEVVAQTMDKAISTDYGSDNAATQTVDLVQREVK